MTVLHSAPATAFFFFFFKGQSITLPLHVLLDKILKVLIECQNVNFFANLKMAQNSLPFFLAMVLVEFQKICRKIGIQ